MTAPAADVWVKVCGITRIGDALVAGDAGVDAIGVNRLARSPRCVTDDRLVAIAAAAAVPTVVLVEDASPDTIAAYLDRVGAGGVQPYGEAAAEVAMAAAAAGWVALLPTAADAVHDVPSGVIPLLDTPDPVQLGGTGRTFDWDTIEPDAGRFVIAGGLGPDNVAEAVRRTGAWGVDASSRLEAEVGVKDPGKVMAFVREARQA